MKRKYNLVSGICTLLILASALYSCQPKQEKKQRPNFLILMSDNHSWNHLGCYGDEVVKTPVIDDVATKGILFNNAFCSAPSCTPARASMLTGQDIWRLEEGANLWGTLPAKFEVYPDILEKAGYLVGIEGKGWGPGGVEESGREHNPGGERYGSFEEFYNEREKGQPFCYWYSSRDPHRPFKRNGGKKAKIDLNSIVVPPYLPDTEEVRGDISDYYAEVQSFDREVGAYLTLLKEMGQLENTVVIVCSDNGWQMPRGLGNLYDFGTKIPMIISMPERFAGNRTIDDFVSLNDLAPTLLELAGLSIPDYMNAKSLVPILEADNSGIIDGERDFIVTARERHAYVRKNGAGYGSRALRNKQFLYIRNYDYEAWPAGDPPLYGDVDAHMLHYPCPTKMDLLLKKEDETIKPLFDLAFAKRPKEELYDLEKDQYQMNNVANDPAYQEAREKLAKQLTDHLKKHGDPRELGLEMKWVDAEYLAEKDKSPRPGQEAIELLNLEEEYYYDNE
ncbi:MULTISPECIES: sulfatase family protein [unclassified Carboxylicivirga]|uniref:sulfatase family protein n=1 Tax=Carboxylicivirga TaxID=1628153 RepID=UPI003D32A13E